jgi:hypothetical protein
MTRLAHAGPLINIIRAAGLTLHPIRASPGMVRERKDSGPSDAGHTDRQSRTVDISAEVKDALKKFRFSNNKGTAAISGEWPLVGTSHCVPLRWYPSSRVLTCGVKIVKAELAMKVDEQFKDQTIEEIAEGTCGRLDLRYRRPEILMLTVIRAARELASLCPHLA